ncbi:hypothetical protein [Nonlabens ponticola]|uniref:Uncharacterized protein n=1 Tax=Nonlabens ponticola TaxID=2496866 RepID=A0A3S9N001_9FLAO|nr:hypothetical protein [Nonlabens ponticola]AZQ44704.1 hypothetical protein EJ995_10805 [Nonlabens ponticola]
MLKTIKVYYKELLSQTLFLLLLFVGIDALYAVLHVAHMAGYVFLDEFLVNTERGYAEVYQYTKEFFCAYLLLYGAIQYKSIQRLAWGLLFLYFFFDDSVQIHENTDKWFGEFINIPAVGSLPKEGVWQLLTGFFLLGVASLMIWLSTKYKESRSFKPQSMALILCVLGLGGFAVVFDAIHALFKGDGQLDSLLALIEDAGEMACVSLSLWVIFTDIIEQRFGIIKKAP